MKTTNETTIFDNPVTEFDLNDIIGDGDSLENDVIPFAQWFNPQDGRKIGLGIREDQAVIANFKPDHRWELIPVTFGDNTENFWVSSNLRIICLNAVATTQGVKGNLCPVYMTDSTTGVTTLFNKNTKTPNHKPWSFFVFCVVDDNNNLISDPIRLKIKQKSHMSLLNYYKPTSNNKSKTEVTPFITNLYEFCQSIGVKFPAGEKPSALFFARGVFEPIMKVQDVVSESSNLKSKGCVVVGYKPIDQQSFRTNFIPNSHPSRDKIAKWLQNILKYVDYKKDNEEITETIETGVVPNEEEVLASLVNGDVPF